jgi:hypothetical protein
MGAGGSTRLRDNRRGTKPRCARGEELKANGFPTVGPGPLMFCLLSFGLVRFDYDPEARRTVPNPDPRPKLKVW